MTSNSTPIIIEDSQEKNSNSKTSESPKKEKTRVQSPETSKEGDAGPSKKPKTDISGSNLPIRSLQLQEKIRAQRKLDAQFVYLRYALGQFFKLKLNYDHKRDLLKFLSEQFKNDSNLNYYELETNLRIFEVEEDTISSIQKLYDAVSKSRKSQELKLSDNFYFNLKNKGYLTIVDEQPDSKIILNSNFQECMFFQLSESLIEGSKPLLECFFSAKLVGEDHVVIYGIFSSIKLSGQLFHAILNNYWFTDIKSELKLWRLKPYRKNCEHILLSFVPVSGCPIDMNEFLNAPPM